MEPSRQRGGLFVMRCSDAFITGFLSGDCCSRYRANVAAAVIASPFSGGNFSRWSPDRRDDGSPALV